MAATRHVPELDGLRALAAFAVVEFHCAAPWAHAGFLGVDVFFVLSGWLITRILTGELERAGRIDLRAFVERRAKRLVPALGVMLVSVACVVPAHWRSILAAAVYMTDFTRPLSTGSYAVTHTWTLAIEAQFYLLWPLALPVLLRLPRRSAVAVLLISWGALAIFREALTGAGVPWAWAYFTPLHASGLVLGAAIAIMPPKLPSWIGWVGFGGIMALVAFTGHGPLPPQQPTWVIAPAELCAAALILRPPAFLRLAPLPQLGAISYGFYLWQAPWAVVLKAPVRPHADLLVIPLALACATASYWLVERPFLRGRSIFRRETDPIDLPVTT